MESIVVKSSNIVDGKESALKMIDDINGKIELRKYSMGILFCAASLDSSELLQTLRDESSIMILGCSSSGEICNDGYLDDSAVLMVLTDDENRFHSGVIQDIKEKTKEQLDEIINKEYENAKLLFNEDPSIMLTFPNFDSIETIKYIFNIVNTNYPDLPMFGGASSIDFNDNSQEFTEFYDGKVYKGSMPFVFINTEEKPITTYENISEYTKYENMKYKSMVGVITSCEDGVIKEIDNAPAYEFIKNSIDVEFEQSELFILYPLLIMEKQFSYTRVILDMNIEKGYLHIAGSVTEGSKVSVQILSYDFVERSSKMAMKNITNKSKNKNFKHAISVSCACRKLINIFDKKREAEVIKEHIHKDVNLIGFYSFGEISPIEDSEGNVYNFYNNETISICLF